MIVPNVYTPEMSIMERILDAAELNQASEHLPRLWSDIMIFEMHRRENMVTRVLELLAKLFPSSKDPKFADLSQKFAAVGYQIWILLESPKIGRQQSQDFYWSGKMLGDLMTIFVKSEDLQKATQVMHKLVSPNKKIVGIASVDSLRILLQACVDTDNAPLALACVQYANEVGYPEAAIFGEDVFLKFKLDPVQRARLNTILGFNVEESASAKQLSQSNIGSA